MTIITSHSLGSIGSSPVSAENPCGENIRYESGFEGLEAELAKQESLNAETVDWQVVARLSSAIIQNSSKDLLVGSYLCYALTVNEGYTGLAVGLNALSEMVDSYWDGLFPPVKRLRARQTAFTWLAEKAGQYVTGNVPGPGDNEAVIAAYDAIKALDNSLVEKMGDQAPMLSEISRPLKNYSQSARAEVEKAGGIAQGAPASTADPVPAAPAPESTPDVVVSEPSAAPATVEDTVVSESPRSVIASHALISIGSSPISEANPCGEDVRYESEFEQLEAELAKRESLNAETVDWQVVSRLSSSIIQNSSKDLLVGSYLSYALLTNEGYLGFAAGLNVLNDMVDSYWEGLYPPMKRLRARKTAFTWLAEMAGQYLTDHPPGPGDNEAVIAANDIIKSLDGLLVEKMGDQAPMLSEVSRPLKNFSQSARAEVEKAAKGAQASQVPATPEPALGATEAAAPAAEPAPASPAKPSVSEKSKPAIAAPADAGSVESDADTKKILRQLQTTMRDIAAFWIAAKLSDPRPYRQGRVAAWMVVESVPPDNAGTTQINPPAPERLKYFEMQADKEDLATLIVELEKTLARSPFWLDGHFLVIQALKKLGSEYEDVIQTIIRELKSFLDRLPAMLQLSFSDGTSFASDQCRMWIETEVLSSGRSGAEAADGAAAELWSSTLENAKQVAAGGDTKQAIALMNEGLANSAQMRDQFYWRFSLADLLLQVGSAEEAIAILEQAGEQAAEVQVATWEPGLLAKIYKLLYQSYQKQQKANKDDKSLEAKAQEAFKKFCWFDPVTALSLRGK